jgi:hypothetical protein
MDKDWEKLWDEWKDSDVGLVAQVDCTDTDKRGGKTLCNYMGIRSFPTIKYGDPNDLDDYDGERTFDDLSEFARENLVPLCSSDRLELCNDDDQKQTITKYMDLPFEELEKLIRDEEMRLHEAEKKYEMTVSDLTEQFKTAERERDTAIEDVMNGDLGLMRSVRTAKHHQVSQTKQSDDTAKTNDEL